VQILRDNLLNRAESFSELTQAGRVFTALLVQHLFDRSADLNRIAELFDQLDIERMIGFSNGGTEGGDGWIDLGKRLLQCARIFHRQVFKVAGAFPVQIRIALVADFTRQRQRKLL
jgi:hypothetical protein